MGPCPPLDVAEIDKRFLEYWDETNPKTKVFEMGHYDSHRGSQPSGAGLVHNKLLLSKILIAQPSMRAKPTELRHAIERLMAKFPQHPWNGSFRTRDLCLRHIVTQIITMLYHFRSMSNQRKRMQVFQKLTEEQRQSLDQVLDKYIPSTSPAKDTTSAISTESTGRRRLQSKVSDVSLNSDGIPRMCATIEDDKKEPKGNKKNKDKRKKLEEEPKDKNQCNEETDSQFAMDLHNMILGDRKRHRRESKATSSGSMDPEIDESAKRKKALLRKAEKVAAIPLPAAKSAARDKEPRSYKYGSSLPRRFHSKAGLLVITVNEKKSDLRLKANDGSKCNLMHVSEGDGRDHEQIVRAVVSHLCKHEFVFSKKEVETLRLQYEETGSIKGIPGKISKHSTKAKPDIEEMNESSDDEF